MVTKLTTRKYWYKVMHFTCLTCGSEWTIDTGNSPLDYEWFQVQGLPATTAQPCDCTGSFRGEFTERTIDWPEWMPLP